MKLTIYCVSWVEAIKAARKKEAEKEHTAHVEPQKTPKRPTISVDLHGFIMHVEYSIIDGRKANKDDVLLDDVLTPKIIALCIFGHRAK